MLPSNMDLKIRSGTVGYNNKILISDGNFCLGKNENVNLLVTVMNSHKTNSLEPTTFESHSILLRCQHTHQLSLIKGHEAPAPLAHEDEKIALVLFITGGFTVWFLFQ